MSKIDEYDTPKLEYNNITINTNPNETDTFLEPEEISIDQVEDEIFEMDQKYENFDRCFYTFLAMKRYIQENGLTIGETVTFEKFFEFVNQ
jgi:hypothetical protein